VERGVALDARSGQLPWITIRKVEGQWARQSACDVVHGAPCGKSGSSGDHRGYLIALELKDRAVIWRNRHFVIE